ncbi:MAG: PBP1A family penicillin-binding protein [Patescibacteria group bacterium]|nr:PBP1A family penicillin-binding protein [Patescibacteria group bacterium]
MKKKFLLKTSAVFLLIFLTAAFWGLLKISQIARELPDPKQFSSRQVAQSSKIYDRTGEVLLYEIYNEEKRTVVPFEEIPDYVRKATISIEDKNFYSHKGFSIASIIKGAIIEPLIGRRDRARGGSTITQQLAKNAFLSSERTVIRKVKELILAYWIEQRYSKDEILELYLNQIPYGSNAYGIEAASQMYLSKSAKDLNLAEAALLASLPKAPTYYSPWGIHKEELLQRKDYTLKQMLDLGFIDDEEFERAEKFPVKFADPSLGAIKAPHFVMMVKDYLANKYGEDFLEKGGLKITTTLDYEIQQIAERVVKEGAERNEELYKGKNAALVAQDPKSGEIIALVGSRDWFDKQNEGNFNVAVQGLRQPGSAFKPFAYLTAFSKGYFPETVVFDAPTEFVPNNPNCPIIVDFSNENDQCYHPENFDHYFRGPINLRNALSQSINVPAVKMLYLAGLDNTIKTAKDFGITTLKDSNFYGLSLVLGGGEVKLIDLINAYSVFSQEGVRHNQKIVLKIEDAKGKEIESSSDQAVQVFEPRYVKMLNDVLSDPEARRPLYSGSFDLTVFDDRQVALKTGTTNDYRDAWTIGYTPYLVAGVWAGNNHQEPMQKNAGSILAALPIWNAFMKEVLLKYPAEPFNKPDEINLAEIQKPMLDGSYTYDIHDILYYVDKNDPLGPIPQNPSRDPQFINWETSSQIWWQRSS